MAKDIEAREEVGYAIVGPYDTIWTDHIFQDAESAEKHVRNFWRGTPNANRTGYRIAPAVMTIKLMSQDRAEFVDLKVGA